MYFSGVCVESPGWRLSGVTGESFVLDRCAERCGLGCRLGVYTGSGYKS